MSDLRRKILDASIDMVAEHGVRSVSFREVARRAGVSHQAPYHHFGNYEGILRAVAQEGFAALASAMNEAAEKAGSDTLRSLNAAGIAYVLFARDHLGHFRVMFQRTLVDVRSEHAPMEEAERTHGTLMRLATAAVDSGYGAGLPPEMVAHVSWSVVHGFATLMVEGILANKMMVGPDQEEHLTRQVVESMSHLLDPKGRSPKKQSKKSRRKAPRSSTAKDR
ncbi:MAG: TetR/AcrR family transcriptional regulator [Myxococcota bacterium]